MMLNAGHTIGQHKSTMCFYVPFLLYVSECLRRHDNHLITFLYCFCDVCDYMEMFFYGQILKHLFVLQNPLLILLMVPN